MSRTNNPLEALTSRLNLSGRFNDVGAQGITSRFANLKPISEFLDIKRISKPRDFGEVQTRVNYNLSYFSSNYAVVFVMLSIWSLLNNLTLTFVIVLVVGGMYGIGKLEGRDLDLGFMRATTSQLYTALLVVAIPLGLFSWPLKTLFWLIGATGVTVLGHAAFLEKDVSAEFEVSAPIIHGHGLNDPYRWDRERRQQRFQELYDDEEEDAYAFTRRQDELYFTGYEMDGTPGYRPAHYGDHSDGENDPDAVLVRAALDRLSRARTKGKTNVNLTLEEMEALERRNGVQQHGYLASPPSTPKSSKAKISGKPGSLTNLAKTRKKSNSPATTPKTTPRSNSKAKLSRQNSADAAPAYPSSPSVLVRGPDGTPMYAPLAYLPPEYPSLSRSRSRSTSQGSRRDTTPPEQIYGGYPTRYFPPASGMRPVSASSSRPFAEDSDFQPRRSRAGSAAQYRVADDYPVMPAVHARSPNAAYSSLRRVPQASSPLASRPTGPQHVHSDPQGSPRKAESGSSSDEQSVRVDIVPDVYGQGYSINKTQLREGETRRRKSRR